RHRRRACRIDRPQALVSLDGERRRLRPVAQIGRRRRPAPMGHDEKGRQTQEFVPGRLAIEMGPLSVADLRRVGAMVRAIHDASMTYTPPADAVWERAIPTPGD